MDESKKAIQRSCLIILGLLILAPSIPLPKELFLRDQHLIWLVNVAGAILLSLLMIISRIKLKLPGAVILSFLLLAVGYLVGVIIADQKDTALLEITRKFALGVIIISAGIILRSKKDYLFLSKFVVMSLLFHSAYGIYELFNLENILKGIAGAPGHANVFAYLIVVTYPLAIALALDKTTAKPWRITAWISVVLSLAMIPFTWSAGAVMALVLPWMALGLISWFRKYRKTTIAITVVGLLVTIAVSFWLFDEGKVAVFSRVDNIEVANHLIEQHPMTGIGPGQFLFRFPDYRSIDSIHYPGYTAVDPRDHIHLEPLQTYMEAGILGVIGLIYLLFFLVRNTLRQMKGEEYSLFSKLIWLSLGAALIQGAVSLAPARQGAIALALAFGVALSQVKIKFKEKNIKPALFILLICLIAGSWYQVRRVQADYYYALGRNQEKYWHVKNSDALRKVSEIWPEELEAKNLITSFLIREVIKIPPGAERRKMINEGLKLTEQTMDMSPQYQKAPVLRAAFLMVDGDTLSAYNTLINADRFVNDPYYQKLLRSAKKCALRHTK